MNNILRKIFKFLIPMRFRRLKYWVDNRVWCVTNGMVCNGPFSKLKGSALDSSIPLLDPAFLLGSWEKELNIELERLFGFRFDKIINIGAAEGYFAVGLLMRCQDCDEVAFETIPVYHEQIRKLAEINGVSNRLRIEGFCNLDTLRKTLVGCRRPFLFVDAEGYEKDLLNPEAIPELRDSFMVVECHDFRDNSITPTLMTRFSATHEIHMVFSHSQYRGIKDLPFTLGIVERMLCSRIYAKILSEGRGNIMHWLIMRPRSSGPENV